MSLLLTCDCPNCFASTLPVVKLNRPAAPDGWWMVCRDDGQVLVACGQDHLDRVLKLKRGAP